MRLLTLFIITLSFGTIGQVNRSLDTVLMGSSFSFTAITDTDSLAGIAVRSAVNEVVRIESLISSWDPNSQTSAINNNAGIQPTKVSYELYELIRRSKKISAMSNGYFDISYASMDRIWDFSKKKAKLPSDASIENSVSKVNFKNIQLNPDDTSVFLVEKGMKIGFGAIGKGYAAEQAKQVMLSNQSKSGVVNAGGDLIAWGSKPDASSWKVGIQDPNDNKKIIMWVPATNTSVVTSGNYERFIEINGSEYCHIINPKLGWPAKNLSSVTVICSNAELADALATTVFVLGTENGLLLINNIEGVECIIIDDQDKMHFSDKIESNIVKNEI
jgi:thiamine biosynthesis lipoprotein